MIKRKYFESEKTNLIGHFQMLIQILFFSAAVFNLLAGSAAAAAVSVAGGLGKFISNLYRMSFSLGAVI